MAERYYSIDDIYPSERNQIVEIWAKVQKAHIGKEDSLNNLFDFKNMAEAEFLKNGFVVEIDITNKAFDGNGNMFTSPVINIVGKTQFEEFDHDRMALEVRDGEFDGIVGTIREDGSFNNG